MAEPAVSLYFSNFLFDLGEIYLPRMTRTKLHPEIRVLSAICALITIGCINPPLFYKITMLLWLPIEMLHKNKTSSF